MWERERDECRLIDAQPRGERLEATMNASKECAITSLREAPCSREFDKTVMNAGLTHEEKTDASGR